MADYYPILARAVSTLAINNAQARQEVYERARAVLAVELSRQDPQKSTLEILRERSALETAIRRVEADLPPGHNQTPMGRPPPRPTTKFADIAADSNDLRPFGDRLKANEAKAQTAPELAQPEEIADSEKRPPERKQTSPEAIASKGNSASTTAPVGQSERQPATIRHLDRPDLEEIFADSISGPTFDGETLRVEFGVTRLDNEKTDSPITALRYSVCRLVLPPTAAVDFINRMQQIAAALTQAGVVKPAPQPGTEASGRVANDKKSPRA
jgi:hypothetical protein